ADSALLQLPDHVEDKVPLHADHSMMVKFDTRNAAGYRTVLDKLRQFAKDAPAVVAGRFTQAHHRPQPCSTVPFKKDPMFVGREDVIGAVTEKHAVTGQRHERVALVGLAGVGKTQTAIEYAYRVRESTPDMWVFWIHASNAARLEEGYHRIATVAEIPGRDDPKTNIFQLVHQWLCVESNGRWLMVLDNADDDQIFFRSDEVDGRPPLVNFLPQVTHGSVLVASRNGLAARNLVGADGLVIDVQPMNEADSLALLRMRIPDSQSPAEDEQALVQALEYIPLAITQAGAYIANRSPLITVSAYLRLFRESESKRIRLLQNEDSMDLRRDPSIRYAVITTWQLSFEQIRQAHPAATDLLALMSMFDRLGIPEDLMRDADQDILDFHDALAPLISYSLIRVEMEERLFDMHGLVQLSVRAWLDTHQQLCGWQANSRKIMAQVFPSGDYENWEQCRLLLAHARSVLEPAGYIDDEDQLNAATVRYRLGCYLYLKGLYNEAEAIYRRALEAREKMLGYDHADTLTTANNLGLVLSSQAKYEEAEAMHRQALEGYEKMLGHGHPISLTSINNLGWVLSSQGRHEEAEAMHRKALEEYEKMLGHEHPKTLTTINNVGVVLSIQGKYNEAEAMFRQDLAGSEKMLGHNHPDTLTSVSNLGDVLSNQGKYEEAEAMHQRALREYEKVLGHEHPKTITSVNNLGLMLSRQGKYKEAEAMHRRAVEVQEKVLGPEHPNTLISVNNLGLVLSSQGKYEEAEVMHRRALEAQEKILGHEHADTLTSVNNLGLVLSDQGKHDEAVIIYRRALEGSEKVLGHEHPDTLISVNNLGWVLSSQGKHEEAEAMHRRAVEAQEKVLGREHPDTLTSVDNLGLVLSSQGKYEEAEVMHRRALEAQEKILGHEHPDTLTSVNNLCHVLSRQGKYEQAEAMQRRALETREKVLGHQHPNR
ncbi:hypothetical protein TCE0_014f01316, partial [Talaromyces pinophilus]